MKKVLLGILTLCVLISFSAMPLYAAMVKTGDSVYLSEDEKDLHDLYLFGNSVSLDAPVTNDLITAGSTVTINGNITGNLMAAGSDVVIRSHVNASERIAGSTVVISGPVDRDLLVAGGTVRITKEASISGDLLFTGGELRVEGPVKGSVKASGGKIIIDAPIGGNVEGTIGELTIDKHAVIHGNLNYTSDQRATVAQTAVIRGQHEFKQQTERKTPNPIAEAFSAGSLYKLAVDIIISMLLITFVPLLVKTTLERAVNKPLGSAGSGFMFLIFLPLLSIFLFILLWVGIASFLFYGFLLIVSIFISKLLIGWYLMRWWTTREKKEYLLDWKAAVIGPVVAFLLVLIPVIGWLAYGIIYLISFGAVTKSIVALVSNTDSPEIIKEKGSKA